MFCFSQKIKMQKNASHISLGTSSIHQIRNLTRHIILIYLIFLHYRSSRRRIGFFQSPKSFGRNCIHAWRCWGFWIRWHWCCLPKVLSCHQRAFKSDENTGKFTKRNGWPLFPLCWVLLAFDVLFQETFYVAVQVREHSIAFLEMKNFFFQK